MARYRIKKTSDMDRYVGVAWLVYTVQCVFAVFNSPNTVLLYDILNAVLCLPLVFVTWWIKEKAPVWAKVLSTVSLLLVSFSPCFLPNKLVVLIYVLSFIILLVSFSLALATAKKVGMNGISWLLELIYLSLVLILSVFDYSGSFSFWKYSLVIGIAVGAAVTVKWFWKKSRFWGRVGYFAMFVFLTFFLSYAFAANLNYALDFEEPQAYVLVIEGKDIVDHRKSPDDYQFEFTVDGDDFSLEASRSEYNTYKIGDTYRVLRYAGAFGEPFYISGEY